MANFVKHEPCPKCGSRNNLGRYDDGSAWCFGGCGHYEPASHSHRISNLKENVVVEKRKKWFDLPDDVGFAYGKAAANWLMQYPVSFNALRHNNVVWSEKWQQLIYKFVVDGRLEAWQGRNFGENAKQKCFTSGDVNTLLPIYGEKDKRDVLVVVEDPLSAINVSGVHPCMPLLGSHLPGNKLHAITMLYDSVIFWLDDNKYKESIDMATRTEMVGTPASTINTQKDPKFYTKPELFRIFNGDKVDN